MFKVPSLKIIGDPEWLAEINNTMDREAKRLLDTEGLSALEQPKSAACAHETGHAVVYTALNYAVRRVEIKRRADIERKLGVAAWGGHTHVRDKWRVYTSTPPAEIHPRICIIISGLVGEHVLDPDGVRSGRQRSGQATGRYSAPCAKAAAQSHTEVDRARTRGWIIEGGKS
jgi:hypothetical protein